MGVVAVPVLVRARCAPVRRGDAGGRGRGRHGPRARLAGASPSTTCGAGPRRPTRRPCPAPGAAGRAAAGARRGRPGRGVRAAPASRRRPAGPARCDVVVLDDGSTDGTARGARRRPARRRRRGRARAGRTPPGWLGKPWACDAAGRGAPATADVLVFVDADVDASPPHALTATVAPAARRRPRPGLPLPAPARRGRRRAAGAAAAAVVVDEHAAARARRALAAAVAGRGQRPAARRRRGGVPRAPAGTRRSAARCSRTSRCCGRSRRSGGRGVVADGSARRHLPDVRRVGRPARRLRQVAVGGVRLRRPAPPRSVALLAARPRRPGRRPPCAARASGCSATLPRSPRGRWWPGAPAGVVGRRLAAPGLGAGAARRSPPTRVARAGGAARCAGRAAAVEVAGVAR